ATLAFAAALAVAAVGAVVVVALRAANDGLEPVGRNWWLAAQVTLAFAYLPIGAVLVTRRARRLLGASFLVVGAAQLSAAVLDHWDAYRDGGGGHAAATGLGATGLCVLAVAVPLLLPWREPARSTAGSADASLQRWLALGVAAAWVGTAAALPLVR